MLILDVRILSSTKKLLSKKIQLLCASSWNMLMGETSMKRLSNTKKNRSCLKNMKFGMYWPRLWWDSTHYIRRMFFIEIWKVLMFSWTRMGLSNWEIWMFLKLQRWGLLILRQVHPTMLHQRFGKTNPMITSLIFGPWAV